jgi:hypothetical protein
LDFINFKYIKIDEKQDKIFYFARNTRKYKWSNPEEKVRAKTFYELVNEYGYSPENIDLEVTAQQGSSGETRADLVIFKPNGETFAVIELKKQDTNETIEKIRKQARSYARSEEINCDIYAYRIGNDPIVSYKIEKSKDKNIDFPFDYDKKLVYASVNNELENKNRHFKNLTKSTPYDLKQIVKSTSPNPEINSKRLRFS